MLNSETKKQEKKFEREHQKTMTLLCKSQLDRQLFIVSMMEAWLEGRLYQLDKSS